LLLNIKQDVIITNKLLFFFFRLDSICYLARPGWPDPPLGRYLGDLTNQLEDDYGPNSFCTEFVAAGPKNYSFRVAVGGNLQDIKTVVKVRGISINSSCADVVTFENLKAMVKGEKELVTVHVPSRIDRVPGWKVVTRSTSKLWRVCLTKRRRIDETETVPYGFQGVVLNQDDYDMIDVFVNLGSSA